MKVLEDNDGNTWVSSFLGMAKFDGVKWNSWDVGDVFSAFPAITGFDIDKDGIVWLYSTHGIGKIENGEYTTVRTIGSSIVSKNTFVKVDINNQICVAIEHESITWWFGLNGSITIKPIKT